MRELQVRILAVAAGVMLVLLAFTFARRQNPRDPGPAPTAATAVAESAPSPAPFPDLAAAGRKVYESQACASCHSIAGAGNPRNPLDGVGERLEAREIRDWILATGEAAEELSDRVAARKRAYRALDEDAMAALTAYMQSLGR